MHGANNPKLCWRVNVDGTKAVIAAAQEHGVTKLVYTSSAGVTYTGGNCIDVDERLPVVDATNAYDTYNLTKAEAEKLVLAANGQGNLKTISLRPSGIFGYVVFCSPLPFESNPIQIDPVTVKTLKDWQMSSDEAKPNGKSGTTTISGIGRMSATS